MSGPGVTVRRARPGDLDALVELRALLFEAMGHAAGPPDAAWRTAAADWFSARLADPGAFAAFLAFAGADRLVGGAAGSVERRTPSPVGSGLRGHVLNVVTRPDARGAGVARRCVEAVLRWYEAETEVTVVELNSTAGGAPLYASLGFVAGRYPLLSLDLADRG